MANVFELPGEWLRCQLHSHTVNSDGDATPAELVAHYAGLGFDVLAITDHHFVTAFSSDDLLVIPSSELTARPTGVVRGRCACDGEKRLPEPNHEFATVEAAARFAVDAGGVAFLAHPDLERTGVGGLSGRSVAQRDRVDERRERTRQRQTAGRPSSGTRCCTTRAAPALASLRMTAIRRARIQIWPGRWCEATIAHAKQCSMRFGAARSTAPRDPRSRRSRGEGRRRCAL